MRNTLAAMIAREAAACSRLKTMDKLFRNKDGRRYECADYGSVESAKATVAKLRAAGRRAFREHDFVWVEASL